MAAQRNALNSKFVDWFDATVIVDRFLCVRHGPPLVRDRPHPDNFAKAIFFSLRAVDAPPPMRELMRHNRDVMIGLLQAEADEIRRQALAAYDH